MKYLLFVVLFAFCEATPGYSDTSYSSNDIGQGSTGNGGAYSYAGSGAGAGFPTGNYPGFVPYFQPFDFSTFFEQLNRQHQEFLKHGGGAFSYSSASSSLGSSAQAQSSISFHKSSGNRIQSNAAGQAQAGYAAGPGGYAPGQGYYQNQGFQGGAAGAGSSTGNFGSGQGNTAGVVGGYGGGYSNGDGSSYAFGGPIGGDGAFASGSIGPGGAHQSAAVYPENPNSPNVNTRFGGGTSGDGGGFKSVFTSSKSVTNNVDGRPQTFRQASTTINDNGKVTTYTAQNP